MNHPIQLPPWNTDMSPLSRHSSVDFSSPNAPDIKYLLENPTHCSSKVSPSQQQPPQLSHFNSFSCMSNSSSSTLNSFTSLSNTNTNANSASSQYQSQASKNFRSSSIASLSSSTSSLSDPLEPLEPLDPENPPTRRHHFRRPSVAIRFSPISVSAVNSIKSSSEDNDKDEFVPAAVKMDIFDDGSLHNYNPHSHNSHNIYQHPLDLIEDDEDIKLPPDFDTKRRNTVPVMIRTFSSTSSPHSSRSNSTYSSSSKLFLLERPKAQFDL